VSGVANAFSYPMYIHEAETLPRTGLVFVSESEPTALGVRLAEAVYSHL